jgi:Flp pilus assembly protein TadG
VSVKALLADRRGGAAIEFAIIAPVLAFLTLGLIDGWSLASSTLNMRTAVQAGAKYLMAGGSEETVLRGVITAAWASPPSDAAVTVEKQCQCDNSTADCSTLCTSTQRPPAAYYSVGVTGSWDAPVKVSFLSTALALKQQQVVRVR